jgi:hypothetical protein
MNQPFGTARYAAQGGAIGALGGDFSSVYTNPAGLGFYRSSEFSVSPSFYWVHTESDYLNSLSDDSRLRFNLGSMGYVAARSSNKRSGFVSGSFAVGYNTLANFNQTMTMQGINNQNTMLDDFTWRANSETGDLNAFYEQVAYDAYLLPYDSIAGEYWNDIQDGGYGQEQRRFVEQSGYIGEYSFSGAFNFSNFLYFGATFGIHSVRFYENIFHTELDPADQILNFDSFQFSEVNTTTGYGFTGRFGMIIRPFQLLRVGASIQIPTYYYLTEEKYTDASSTWDRSSGIPAGSAFSPIGVFDYRLQTPMRVQAHASAILFKLATFSAAYEYIDYSGARLDAYSDKFFEENNRIRAEFQDVHNLKAGGEIRIASAYFRGGLQYLMSPYRDSRNDAEQWIASAGIGVRTKTAFFDVSYSRGSRTEVYGLYDPWNGSPESSYTSINEVRSNNVIVTMGLKF